MESLRQVAARMSHRTLSVAEQVTLARAVVRSFFRGSRFTPMQVDDCLSDVLEDLARHPLADADERGSAPLLIRRVRWRLCDSLRRMKRHDQQRGIVEALELERSAACDDDSELRLHKVLSVLESLDPIDVDLIVSTTAYGETLEVVAQRTGLSVSGAWRRRERAIVKVRVRSGMQRSSGSTDGGSGGRS
jgi:DNA-directed RNA polymerase specialized sigma24 family protein